MQLHVPTHAHAHMPPNSFAGMLIVSSSSKFVALGLQVPPKAYEVSNLAARHDAVSIQNDGPVWVWLLPDKGSSVGVRASSDKG